MQNKTIAIELIGWIAMILSIISFFPQAYSVWKGRPKPATSISLPMYTIFNIGVVLWVIYGVAIDAQLIWLTNAAIAIPAFSVLAYKLIYG